MSAGKDKRIAELIREDIAILPYDPQWPKMFDDEKRHLRTVLPKRLIRRIEHFGSTAVPGLSAKPVIDILVEVSSLEETKKFIVPILEAEGYEYFWRPTIDNKPPYYTWFVKRNLQGLRTHHIHMVESDSELWERLLFRDYLKEFPEEAYRYEKLKTFLSMHYPNDRLAYTKGKTDYILSVNEKASKYYLKTHQEQHETGKK